MSTSPRRATVVGAGDISRVHLAALASIGVEVAAVVDLDLARAQERAASVGAVGSSDLEAVLAAGDIDVVHVCTPHDQHLPVVVAALEAGVHVLVEKPLAHRLEDAERLAEAAASADVKTGVCFQNRYNGTSRAMKEMLDGGGLGRIVAASATVAWSRTGAYYDAKPWAGQSARSGGGALINQSIHTIDLLQWLVGPVKEISGRASQLVPLPGVDVEDTATLTMLHEGAGGGRVRSTMWATNTNATNAPVTIDILGENGSLSLRGDLTITAADGSVSVVSDTPADPDVPAYWGLSHEALIADFYGQLDAAGPFWISPADALPAQRILSGVYEQSGLYGSS
ncbi:Gfo/Idh/MocA family protein [Pseudactinotalea sp.]|uniref:Gfo/Idh/MocA family protein n=1 Tax=Pseudactinotalea sp. TaxID=1926260 RepID=UPI003B3B56DD